MDREQFIECLKHFDEKTITELEEKGFNNLYKQYSDEFDSIISECEDKLQRLLNEFSLDLTGFEFSHLKNVNFKFEKYYKHLFETIVYLGRAKLSVIENRLTNFCDNLKLTLKEREYVYKIANHVSYNSLKSEMCVTRTTVDKHLKNITIKLGKYIEQAYLDYPEVARLAIPQYPKRNSNIDDNKEIKGAYKILSDYILSFVN